MKRVKNGINRFFQRRKKRKFPEEIYNEPAVRNDRREFIKNLAVFPIFGGVFFDIAKKIGGYSFEEETLKKSVAIKSTFPKNSDSPEAKLPFGKIKNVTMSRMMAGGNLISGFAHSRDLTYVSKLVKTYHTDEKVFETLQMWVEAGINTVQWRTDDHTVGLLKEFWRRGGEIQWLAQTNPKGEDLSNIQMAIDNGAIGAYVQGPICDNAAKNNQVELLAKYVDFTRSQGILTGLGGHTIIPARLAIENGIKPDFFMKTFHHDNYWSANRENQKDNIYCLDAGETTDFFKKCEIPWIAFKTMAAGAIKPEDGFRFAFEKGADFIAVGMFDFQIRENINIASNILNSELKRERKWYA